MNKYMTATQARKKFYDVIEMASKPGRHIIITLNGLPRVAIVSYKEFEKWQTGHRRKK